MFLYLMKSVKAELDRMERLGMIAKVTKPTEWYSGMVVVPKKGGRLRICVDLTKLNKNVCRERHILPAVEQTLTQLVGAKVFSKLDANSGFWQILFLPSHTTSPHSSLHLAGTVSVVCHLALLLHQNIFS